ncbi:MAG: alpha-amylase family glycosyl hydrolase [Anaerolineaceae bacterium]
MKKSLTILLTLVILFTGCSPQSSTQSQAQTPTLTVSTVESAAALPWWRTAVFYEIFVRSFYDSNGDGIGDFNGITQKLDYLNDGNPDTHTDLGITAIWLMPIHPSPSYHGYDVLNYYAVNSEYGTLEDFKNLIAEAHKRGIRVIIDLVLNHTSDQHPFFVDAKRSVNSTYHDWYVWSESNPGDKWYPVVFGTSTLYYYGYFCGCMPDLNYRNPEVTAQMENVAKYWLETVGVDGFRVDAAKHLIEDGKVLMNTPETHDWFKGFYTFYKGLNPDSYVVGEVASSDARIVSTYTGDQMDQIFDFEFASGVMNSVKGESISSIKSVVIFTQKDMPDWNFGTFLTNHDQDRVMSVLGGNVDKAKVAAFILLTSPGTPFIYYGEEIGMSGQKPDENIRRPMQWSNAANAGFSSAVPWEALDPGYTEVNVQKQSRAFDSLMTAYQSLILLRNSHPALSQGEYFPVVSENSGVYAFFRKAGSETLLVVVNLTRNSLQDYPLGATGLQIDDGQYTVQNLQSGQNAAVLAISSGKFENYAPISELSPYTGYVFVLAKQ